MTTVTPSRRDARPLWLRLLVWFGILISAGIGLPMLIVALPMLDEPAGGFLLCFALVLLLAVVGGTAREVTERRLQREPLQARPDRLPDGEQALLLPRATAPTAISSWLLVGVAAVVALGAVLAAVERSWVLAVVLGLVAGWLGVTAAPHRTATMAGGLWLSPTRIVDDYRGVRWELTWQDATGVDAHHPQRVLVAVRPDRVPRLERTGPRGRAWKPIRAGNVLVIDTNHIAGASAHAGQLIDRALTDPASRTALGG